MVPMILDVPAAEYHADAIGDAPTLSASVAKLLVAHSPAHARAAHPRLNPNYERVEEDKFSVGTAAHAVLLEGRDIVSVVAAEDWRTNDAKALRDEIRQSGRIPLLNKQWAEVEAMCEAVREQLDRLDVQPPLFKDGKPEQTIFWEDSGVACRARLDWLRDDLAACDDLKSTSRVGGANPEAYSRALYAVGGDVQCAFYLRGVKALTGATPEWRWCVVETAPPYALSVISPGPDVLAIGESKVKYALEVWKRCLDSGVWPGYPDRVCYAELPAWEDTRWLEKTTREGIAA